VLEDNNVIFGARVCARASLLNTEYCGYSNADGRFRLAEMPAGNYSVHITDLVGRFLDNCAGERACTDPTRFGVTDRQGAVLSHVSLDPTYNQTRPTPTPDPTVGEAVVSGRVIDADGRAAVGSKVCVESLSLLLTTCALTNENGEYAIEKLPTSNYVVQFADGSCYGARGGGCASPSAVGVVSPLTRYGISTQLEG